jgi:hypothetical protein
MQRFLFSSSSFFVTNYFLKLRFKFLFKQFKNLISRNCFRWQHSQRISLTSEILLRFWLLMLLSSMIDGKIHLRVLREARHGDNLKFYFNSCNLRFANWFFSTMLLELPKWNVLLRLLRTYKRYEKKMWQVLLQFVWADPILKNSL